MEENSNKYNLPMMSKAELHAEHQRDYRAKHREHNREYMREYMRAYRQSETGKANIAKVTEAGKQRRAEYNRRYWLKKQAEKKAQGSSANPNGEQLGL